MSDISPNTSFSRDNREDIVKEWSYHFVYILADIYNIVDM